MVCYVKLKQSAKWMPVFRVFCVILIRPQRIKEITQYVFWKIWFFQQSQLFVKFKQLTSSTYGMKSNLQHHLIFLATTQCLFFKSTEEYSVCENRMCFINKKRRLLKKCHTFQQSCYCYVLEFSVILNYLFANNI